MNDTSIDKIAFFAFILVMVWLWLVPESKPVPDYSLCSHGWTLEDCQEYLEARTAVSWER